MNRGETLIDLARQYPRIAVGAAVFAVVIAVSQNVLVAIVLAVVVASQTKEEWIDAFSANPTGYLDRSGGTGEESIAGSAEALVRPEQLDREDAEEAEWIAPAAAIPGMRREPSDMRYGIAVPPKKPVDVPRR